jgi:tetratricopeptide (TPR) repeat protein
MIRCVENKMDEPNEPNEPNETNVNIYETIDKKMMEGYELLAKRETVKACDKWLDTWEELKELLDENAADSIHEFSDRQKYDWSELPLNYVQDLEMELGNAGLDAVEYYRKRIRYCEELLEYVGNNQLIEGNTRRAIADSYFELGDSTECDRLYEQWLDNDPQWGWGYIGWFMCYEDTNSDRQDISKASEIIERALTIPEIRDRLEVVDRALVFYEKHGGDAGQIETLRSEFSRLTAASPGQPTLHKAIPLISDRIGRNDPCPCGSGKKYKKCHGEGHKD